ncbi:hypothetical protein GGR39_002248 [Novosphingobium fluoreni]|uniref:Peptidase n=1 Tax=Novosphingobium fluoreni TaxID=1391222 RepID=A0A7W6FYU2_9SPHN|nr:peptidase [Novosphingobium fluoreni]MBB3940591.1 hypothetical protein [Novosphingobium fluoreni]
MAFFTKRFVAATAAAGFAVALGGCSSTYGYGGLGYNSGYYNDYGYGYGPNLAYGGSPYGGWYNDFYYPGYGVYVFDRGGRRTHWNDGQRRYWEGRRGDRDGRGWQGQYRQGQNWRGQNWRGQNGQGQQWRGRDWRGRNWQGQDRQGQNQQGQGWRGQGWQGQRWQGRPDGARPGGVTPGTPATPGSAWRGQWRENRGAAGVDRPASPSFNGWRGRGGAEVGGIPRAGGFEGRANGGGRSGWRGGPRR